ncbi:MAG: glycoside hydrolase family 13 protein [Clostridia bacterium]
MRHHSRLLTFRSPQGAAPCNTRVHIEAEVAGDEGAVFFLRLWREGGSEELVRMTRGDGRIRADIMLPEVPCLMWYFFVIHTSEGQTFYYGTDSGEGMFAMHEPQSYQITVYDGAFTTPQHVREGIAYQIFPDRFKRSSWEDFRGRAQYHIEKGRFLRIHDRWSEEICTTPSPGQVNYSPDDFYGGDLNGIREKLPYLQELGVTMLYLNPIFESPSNHRYDTADYNRVDPILGNEEELAALCRDAAERGIHIMLDGVFSHTGADSRYFDRFHRYDGTGATESMDSPYYPWYTFRHYPDVYDCWWNFPALPNVNELNPAYSDFIVGDNGVLRHWANVGATSWRLDVADELPDAFLRMLRRRIKQNDPNALLMGEVWEDCSNKYGADGRRGYVSGDELDCAMNYPFRDAVVAFLIGKIDAHGLNQKLQTLREHYPKPFFDACFNLLSSHDIVRASTALSDAPDRNALNREQQATYVPSPENAARGRQRLILATALQVSLPGVPCVYYGDEAGMTGMADPFNRGTYPWGSEDTWLQQTFRKLLHARRDSDALKRGYTRMGALSPEVFAVVRYTENGQSAAALIVNRSEAEQTICLRPERLDEGPDADKPVSLDRSMTDVLTGECAYFSGDGVTLPKLSAKLWIS